MQLTSDHPSQEHLNDNFGVVVCPLLLTETLLHQHHLDWRPTNWWKSSDFIFLIFYAIRFKPLTIWHHMIIITITSIVTCEDSDDGQHKLRHSFLRLQPLPWQKLTTQTFVYSFKSVLFHESLIFRSLS